MLVIAAYFKRGQGVMPGAEELARKLAKMLTGEMGLFLVYSTDPAPDWWWGKPAPFKCRARPGCRVWKIPTGTLAQDTAGAAPNMMLADGREMDVLDTWMPGSTLPAWFVVFRTSAYDWVCLADETLPQQEARL
jgi:hypothetical protein